ncbi:MAG: thiol reductant ABC exporter subunit CydC [Gammaproteobacteria bacterium]|nr:MAG: thiol reductant ABC exporter subunit CydC [Gammaproteobacteria bacterium]
MAWPLWHRHHRPPAGNPAPGRPHPGDGSGTYRSIGDLRGAVPSAGPVRRAAARSRGDPPVIGRLLRLYRPHLGWLALGTLLALATLLANIGLLTLSGWFIAAMAAAGLTGTAINYFTPAAIIRGLAMIRTGGRYGERLLTHEATFRLIAGLRSWFYQRIEPLAPAGLAELRSGDLLGRLQKDIDRLDAVYLRILMPLVVALLAVALTVFFISLYSPVLALILCLLLLVGGLLLPLWVWHGSRSRGPREVELAGRLRTEAIDLAQGMAELQAYGADRQWIERWQQSAHALVQTQDERRRPQSLSGPALILLAHLAVFATLLIAVPLLRSDLLAPPQLAMLALCAIACFEAITPLPQAFASLSETAEAARRLFGIVDRRPPIEEPSNPRPVPETGEVRFEGVTLRYAPQLPPALDSIELRLPQNSLTLLTGPSGAGKTSVVNLLLRFLDPSEGCIRFAGQDLRAFDSDHWRQRITVVSQDAQLIAGTIRDNLLLGRPDADQGELLAACRQAHILDFIESLPDGLDTWVGETGVNLSGGQARRIAIARALLKSAPLVLLDEPTEGLDRATEREVVEALRSLLQDRTVLLISHRPLPLGEPDQILYLEEGRLRPDD